MLILIGLFLIVFGIVYLRFPTLFRRGLWLKTSIAIRTMTPEGYVSYMKRCGIMYIGAGVVCVIAGVLTGK